MYPCAIFLDTPAAPATSVAETLSRVETKSSTASSTFPREYFVPSCSSRRRQRLPRILSSSSAAYPSGQAHW